MEVELEVPGPGVNEAWGTRVGLIGKLGEGDGEQRNEGD